MKINIILRYVTFYGCHKVNRVRCIVSLLRIRKLPDGPKFYSPTDALSLILENTKIYIKTYIKIAATCFGLRPSSGSLHLSLAKVTLMLKQSLKLRRYVFMRWCGSMLCPGMVCVLCRVRLRQTLRYHCEQTIRIYYPI
jgi:hypothetical protein